MRVENRADKSLGELFNELASGFSTMFLQQIALAKAEVKEDITHNVKDVVFLALGGVLLYAAFYAFPAAVVVGLSEVVPVWLSAIIVGAVVSVAGCILVRKGLEGLKARQLNPGQTIESLKEDKEWVRAKI